ncbi:MAG TPA: hypothetical protein VGC41_21970, partial [Kofleriaceae bacterium]
MRARIAFALATLLAACSGEVDSGNPGGDGSGSNIPFEPVGPSVYVAKVKNLMTGLPATDAEVAAVTADSNALKGLIDQWMQAPEFQARMEDFFRNAFQQNNVNLNDLNVALGNSVNFTNMNGDYRARLERSLMDSFPQTVWQLVAEGKPFTDALTTNRFMLTTAQMAMLEYSDERPTDDANKTQDRLANRQALPGFTFDPKSTATLEQTLDPTSSNYMVWHDPVTIPATCTTTPPVVYTNLATGDKGAANYRTLFSFIFGQATYDPCYMAGQNQKQPPILTDADFTDYHMVTIHTIGPTEATSPAFWNITANRAAADINLHVPRIGFSGTMAFATNWATNSSNEARVTANQALIVAIGTSIAGENTTTPFPVNAVDSDHASDAACAGCHNQLDPMKQYFRQSWTLNYHDQQDPAVIALPAGFNIGVTAQGTGIGDLMATLANHPKFGTAWVQKLQFWANSLPADETDPEVARIAKAFQDSGWDFKTLVRETFSSPLVTYAASTQTTRENGVILSISRRDQYCAALSNRLGLADVCGMETAMPTAAQTKVAGRALLMPVDTYYRAFALPSLPTNPDLFFRSSTEAICGLIADQVIDLKTGASKYSSTDPTTAINDFVATIMNVPPGDPRSGPAIQILTDHFTAAKGTMGVSATDALKSTFTTACLAP